MGKRLIITGVAASMLPLVAACAASGSSPPRHSHARVGTNLRTELGRVTGTFERVGGPLGPSGAQPKPVRLSGTITFTAAQARPVLVRVGRSGIFTVRLAAGSYRVTGRSPQVGGPGQSTLRCAVPLTVDVLAGHATRLKVVCPVP
jgi:hypothetical protein